MSLRERERERERERLLFQIRQEPTKFTMNISNLHLQSAYWNDTAAVSATYRDECHYVSML